MSAPILIAEKPLSKKYRGFIKDFVESGDDLWAFHEHYAESKGSKMKARKLRTKLAVHIDRALQEYMKGTDLAAMAIAVVRKLAEEAESEPTRLAAAKDILSRGGFDQAQEIKVTKEVTNMTDEAIDKRLQELQKELWKNAPMLEVVGE